MSDDFHTFKAKSTAGNGDGGEPPDGNHTATLVRAVVGESRNGGTLIICEWQTPDFRYYWTTFRGVAGGQERHAGKFLTGLGIDMQEVSSWDELGDRLAVVEGETFVVAVQRNGTFLNTSVVEKAGAVQTALPVATPAAPPPATVFDDDDVPF